MDPRIIGKTVKVSETTIAEAVREADSQRHPQMAERVQEEARERRERLAKSGLVRQLGSNLKENGF